MGVPVPADDLPPNAVPASDLPPAPGARAAAPSAAPVTPTEPPSTFKRGMDMAETYMRYGTPWSLPARAVEEVGHAVEKGAYHAGGAVTDILSSGNRSILNPLAVKLPPEVAGGAGVLTNMGVQAVPAFAGGPLAKAATPGVVKEAGKKLGERWMQQALSPSKAARESGDAAIAQKHLLETDRTQLSKGGVNRMTSEIDKLDEALEEAIKKAPDVNTVAVLSQGQKMIARFKDSTDHPEIAKAIFDEITKFFAHNNIQGRMKVPAETAQNMKRAAYDDIYASGYKKPLAEIRSPESRGKEAGKNAIARGLSEGLSEASPEAAAINAQMGPRIKARDLVEERISAHGNKMDGGLLYMITHPWTIPLWVAERSPYLNALRARAAYQNQVPGAIGTAAGIGAGAVSAQRPKEYNR